MTARCMSGRAAMASSTTERVSAERSRSSGWPSHDCGGAAQLPAGAKRDGSTAGSACSLPLSSDEKGTLRCSRTPLVLARLTRMRKIHVLSDERPSKRSRPLRTPSHVSATASSACSLVATYDIASRSNEAWWRWTSEANACSSPFRRASSSAPSSSTSEPVRLQQTKPYLADGRERRDGVPQPVERHLAGDGHRRRVEQVGGA